MRYLLSSLLLVTSVQAAPVDSCRSYLSEVLARVALGRDVFGTSLQVQSGRAELPAFERLFALYDQGRIAPQAFGRSLIALWEELFQRYPRSEELRIVEWFGRHGDDRLARELAASLRLTGIYNDLGEREVRAKATLFSALIEIGLVRGLPTDLAEWLERIPPRILFQLAEFALERGQDGAPGLPLREEFLRSARYLKYASWLEQALNEVEQRKSFGLDLLKHAYFGLYGRVGTWKTESVGRLESLD